MGLEIAELLSSLVPSAGARALLLEAALCFILWAIPKTVQREGILSADDRGIEKRQEPVAVVVDTAQA